MSNGIKSLEDQFYDQCGVCFNALKRGEEAFSEVKGAVQRLFVIQSDLSKLRSGKKRAGRTSSLKRSPAMKRAVSGFMAIVAGSLILSSQAADLSLEPSVQKYTMVTSNWSMTIPPRPTTNGFTPAYEVQTITTNTTLLYTFADGREKQVVISSVSNKIVGERTNSSILPPLSRNFVLPTRTR